MKIIGHRGAMGHAPENTLASIIKALELKVDAIELDVHLCKTGELVVIHDNDLSKTTNGSGKVSETSLEEIKKLDAGEGEKVPTLKEVLDLVAQKAALNLELKGVQTLPAVVNLLKECLKNKWQPTDFIVSSFNHHLLQKFHKLMPNIKIAALISSLPLGYASFAKKIPAKAINISLNLVTPEFVKDSHQREVEVYLWTVNSIEDFNLAKSLKVDGIFTDYPDRFLNIL